MNTEDSQGRIAGPSTQEDRTIKHFLHETSEFTGRTFDGCNLGHHKALHLVFCFAQHESLEGFPVITSVRSGCFSSQSYYTSAEARVLARALIAAADHADELHGQSQQLAA